MNHRDLGHRHAQQARRRAHEVPEPGRDLLLGRQGGAAQAHAAREREHHEGGGGGEDGDRRQDAPLLGVEAPPQQHGARVDARGGEGGRQAGEDQDDDARLGLARQVGGRGRGQGRAVVVGDDEGRRVRVVARHVGCQPAVGAVHGLGYLLVIIVVAAAGRTARAPGGREQQQKIRIAKKIDVARATERGNVEPTHVLVTLGISRRRPWEECSIELWGSALDFSKAPHSAGRRFACAGGAGVPSKVPLSGDSWGIKVLRPPPRRASSSSCKRRKTRPDS